jgi:chemotaxis signal transduction protein
MNFHGDIVAVMDLALLLGQSACSHSSKIIVLHRKIASLAFLVDSVVKIVSEDEVSFSSPTTSQFTLAILTLPGGEATQLNLEALVLEAEKNI